MNQQHLDVGKSDEEALKATWHRILLTMSCQNAVRGMIVTLPILRYPLKTILSPSLKDQPEKLEAAVRRPDIPTAQKKLLEFVDYV